MYEKKEFYQLFKSVPLPFKIFRFPESGSPPENRSNSPLYYSHKMTTDLTLQVFEECGFHSETNAMLCHILIGRSFSDQQLQSLNDFQKCCHFSSTYLMGTKSELHNRMKELKERFGTDVTFYPRSYYPPDDVEELLEAWPMKKYWIIKAPALSRAREIRIASSKEEKAPLLPYIVEEYIERPYLISGRKFDIRLYALITSINPLTIYYHRQGLSLFAVHQYKEDEEMNLNDLQMHLTNYEINKTSDMFVECNGIEEKIENSKWSLPFLWNYFDGIGIDSKKLRQEVEDVSTAAIIACMCSIRNVQNKNIKYHRKSSFEFVGVDILLDSDLKPYLLEINISPSMAGTSKLDEKIKLEVAHDLYNLVRILDVSAKNPNECMGYFAYEQEYFGSKKRIIDLNNHVKINKESINNEGFFDGIFGLFSENKKIENESMKITREKAVVDGLLDPWKSPTFAEYTIIREFIEEQERSRGFHRAYPRKKNIKQFEKCFDAYNYEDIVLNEWLKMDKRKRFEVLIENFDVYYNGMQKCYEMRDKGDPEGKRAKSHDDSENEQLNKTDEINKKNLNSENIVNKQENNNVNDDLTIQQVTKKIENSDEKNENQIIINKSENLEENDINNISKGINENDDINKNQLVIKNNLDEKGTFSSNEKDDQNIAKINNDEKEIDNEMERESNKNEDVCDNKQNVRLNEEVSSSENLILIIDDIDDENSNNDSGCQIQ